VSSCSPEPARDQKTLETPLAKCSDYCWCDRMGQAITVRMEIKNKRFFFGLCILGLLVQTSSAAPAQAPATAQAKHCFWKVEGKSNSVFLLGSVHVLNNTFYPLDPIIEDAFKKANTLVLEVDLKEMESMETQLKMLKFGRYPEGDSLTNHLTPEIYKKLDERMAKTGGSAAMFNSFKPWMVAVVLVAAELQKLGFNPQDGVDRYFHQKAIADEKKVTGLETAEFQLSLFNDLTRAEEEAMLKETFEEMDTLKKDFEDLTRAWKTGDTETLDKTMVQELRGYPDIYKKLLVDRNERWAKQMDRFLAEGKDIFVVVGA